MIYSIILTFLKWVGWKMMKGICQNIKGKMDIWLSWPFL